MIQEFVDRFMAAENRIMAELRAKRPASYESLVTRLIELLNESGEYHRPDPKRITVIDHGDYQGTKLFIIGAGDYQPSKYWSIFVNYGSCEGCDTFLAINDYDYSDKPPTEKQAREYWTLMLHMVQGMKVVGAESD